MGRRKTPGLIERGGIWHIDKKIRGRRLCESTGTGDLAKAEEYLSYRLEEIRQARVYGVRPTRTLLQAATLYLEESRDNRAIRREADALRIIMEHIDPHTPLEQIHDGTFDAFRKSRR